MPVPFIDLKRLVSRVRADVLPAFAECIDNCELVGGPRIPVLEEKLAGALGVPHAVACGNGTDALIIGLQALGVKRGMKVALPDLTFWATFEAIVQLGAIPVLVDVDAEDLQLDFEQLKSAHAQHELDAVVLVHLFGWTSARLGEIRAFCKERDLILLEDGAQCFGVEVGGEPVLAKAALATLSFYPAKVVGGAMDGGAMTMQTAKQQQYVRSLCNHGRSDHYAYAHVGWNSRMGGMQAAFIIRMLDEVPSILESRRSAARFYRERLGAQRGVKVYGPPAGVTENGYLNVITVEGKTGAELAEGLKAKGIGTARTYPEPMHTQPPVKSSGAILHGDLAVATRFCERVINLPLFAGIRDDEREESAAALLSLL